MKTCKGCGELKEITEYYKHKTMADGHLNKCKTCIKDRVSKHRQDNLESVQEYDRNRTNKEDRNEYNKDRHRKLREVKDPKFMKYDTARRIKYAERFPEKHAAQNALSNAIRDGKITRPYQCSSCNALCNPQGHHWSYHTSKQLDVIWLCVKCHTKEHNRLRELGRCPDTNNKP